MHVHCELDVCVDTERTEEEEKCIFSSHRSIDIPTRVRSTERRNACKNIDDQKKEKVQIINKETHFEKDRFERVKSEE